MVGHFGVGKTSLVRRFVESMFEDKYLTTLGVKIDKKEVVVNGQAITLMLWDIAGEDDLAQLRVAHLRGAHGYILVVDGCRAVTLEKAKELQKRVTDTIGPVPFILVINKCDLRDRWEVLQADIEACGWPTFETSAKSGSGVEEMFLGLASRL
jgi:small GTP-binding protein